MLESRQDAHYTFNFLSVGLGSLKTAIRVILRFSAGLLREKSRLAMLPTDVINSAITLEKNDCTHRACMLSEIKVCVIDICWQHPCVRAVLCWGFLSRLCAAQISLPSQCTRLSRFELLSAEHVNRVWRRQCVDFFAGRPSASKKSTFSLLGSLSTINSVVKILFFSRLYFSRMKLVLFTAVVKKLEAEADFLPECYKLRWTIQTFNIRTQTFCSLTLGRTERLFHSVKQWVGSLSLWMLASWSDCLNKTGLQKAPSCDTQTLPRRTHTLSLPDPMTTWGTHQETFSTTSVLWDVSEMNSEPADFGNCHEVESAAGSAGLEAWQSEQEQKGKVGWSLWYQCSQSQIGKGQRTADASQFCQKSSAMSDRIFTVHWVSISNKFSFLVMQSTQLILLDSVAKCRKWTPIRMSNLRKCHTGHSNVLLWCLYLSSFRCLCETQLYCVIVDLPVSDFRCVFVRNTGFSRETRSGNRNSIFQ